jgi:acylphosphatase
MDPAVFHAAVRCHKQNDIAGIPVIQNAFLSLSAHNRIIMKLQITISGPKVHDVGYRCFLMDKAMASRIKMFEAHNIEDEQEQQVMVLVDGGEKEVDAFRKLAQEKRPNRAIVSRIVVGTYEGDVMRVGEYAQFCTTIQLDKAIPVLLDIRDDLKELKGDVKELRDDVKELKGDMKGTRENVKSLVDGQRILLEGQKETIDEIRGLRDDLAVHNNIEWQARIENDIRMIKSKIGIL